MRRRSVNGCTRLLLLGRKRAVWTKLLSNEIRRDIWRVCFVQHYRINVSGTCDWEISTLCDFSFSNWMVPPTAGAVSMLLIEYGTLRLNSFHWPARPRGIAITTVPASQSGPGCKVYDNFCDGTQVLYQISSADRFRVCKAGGVSGVSKFSSTRSCLKVLSWYLLS